MNDSNNPINDFLNFDFSSLGKSLNSLSPLEFATLGSLIGISLIPLLSTNEQNSIGNFLELIGQALLASAAQGQLQTPSINPNEFESFKQKYQRDISIILNKINNQDKNSI